VAEHLDQREHHQAREREAAEVAPANARQQLQRSFHSSSREQVARTRPRPGGYHPPSPMAEQPAYDLMVLIDPDITDERRDAIVQEVKRQIESGKGRLAGDVEWGVRRLAFEIDHRPQAYYHLFQLEAEPELLDQLRHMLAIDDAVLRHRLIRLERGIPETPPRPSPPADRRPEGAESAPEESAPEESAPEESAPEESAEPSPESAPAPEAPPAS
jgi:small subunit ribosomal protein S6